MKQPKFTARIVRDLGTNIQDLKRRVGADKRVVKVGIPEGKTHQPDGTPLALIGAAHQFGVPDLGIPERPWLTGGIKFIREQLVRLNRINLIKVIRGQMTLSQALGQMGNMAVGGVRQYIRTKPFAPLALSTLLRRGRAGKKASSSYKKTGDAAALEQAVTPLVDSGQLINGITYVLEEK